MFLRPCLPRCPAKEIRRLDRAAARSAVPSGYSSDRAKPTPFSQPNGSSPSQGGRCARTCGRVFVCWAGASAQPMPVATPAPHDDYLKSARAACNSTYPALRYIAGLFVAPGSTRRLRTINGYETASGAKSDPVLYAIRRIIVWRLSPRQAIRNIRRIKCSAAGDSLLPPELGRLAKAKGRGPIEGPGFFIRRYPIALAT